MLKRNKHERSKRYCEIYKQKREVGHLCYMRPLKDILPTNAYKVLYVFYDFQTTQNKKYSVTAKAYVHKLLCVQRFCASCKDVDCEVDLRDVEGGGFLWNDPVGDLLNYLCETPPGKI